MLLRKGLHVASSLFGTDASIDSKELHRSRQYGKFCMSARKTHE